MDLTKERIFIPSSLRKTDFPSFTLSVLILINKPVVKGGENRRGEKIFIRGVNMRVTEGDEKWREGKKEGEIFIR